VTGRTLQFTVPGHRVQLLNANQRLHWRRKAERGAYWRELTRITLDAAGHAHGGPWQGRAHVVVTFAFPDRRRRDVGNLAPTVKHVLDGIVLAGVLADDSDEHVLGPDIRRDHGPFAVTVTIRDADPRLTGYEQPLPGT
jgi:Holliday junction resolvase RusA-like endonuclease